MLKPYAHYGGVPIRLGATGHGTMPDVASAAFAALDQHALAQLAERAAAGETVRLWVPNCGDGAGAFALAALLHRRLGDDKRQARPRIFATEPDERVVKKASTGLLDRPTARAFLKAGFRRNFIWTGAQWQVRAGLRGRIIFSVQDTLHDTPFADIDFIDASRTLALAPGACSECVVRRLMQAVALDGFLYVGPGHRFELANAPLHTVDRVTGLYRRTRRRTSQGPPQPLGRGGSCHGAALLERVVRHFAPAALVVDAAGAICGTTGDGSSLLATDGPPYAPTLGTGTEPALRSAIISAFLAARTEPTPVVRPVAPKAGTVVRVMPLQATDLDLEPLWLVELVDDHDQHHPPADGREDEAWQLRRHLVTVSESLRRAMDELTTRQLRLGSANDELQASIDDLEATNRRLAAMNAELIAVRQEHERQIAELNALNLDVENLFRAADVAVVVLDESSRLRRYTPAAGRMFRLARTDLGHKVEALLDEGNRPLARTIAQVQQDGASRQVPVSLPDSTASEAGLARVHPFRGDDERVTGVIFSVVDVSELKTTQQSLEQQNVALKRANEDLERFAYIASHDLKSPLRSVRTMLEFLRTDLGPALDGENLEHLDLVAQRVQQMEQMIQDLLTYSRVGRQGGTPEPVNVAALVRAQLELVPRPEGFTVTIDAGLPTITTDAGLLEHVIRNLVGNAIKHHDRERGRIDVRAVRDAPVLTIEVADDGPGIPSRHQQRVMEIFQKAGSRADAGGSGMGLALVKKAVERNGGTLELISRDGERGTTFRFTWPESGVHRSDQSA